MKTRVLIETIHGSHLYGLETPQSDRDIYQVYDFNYKNHRPQKRKQAKHKIDDVADNMIVSLDRFNAFCYAGVPQALEVLYAMPNNWINFSKEWIDISQELRQRIMTDNNIKKILDTYKRTSYSFMAGDDFKKNRHAMRLAFNAAELKEYRDMNPTLPENIKHRITAIAQLPYNYRVEMFREWFFSVFDDVE